MTEAITSLGLIVITLAWFGLPLLPTILEVRKRAEAHPLPVDREHDGEVRHFARRFKTYLESHFHEPPLEKRLQNGDAREGHLSDRTPYQIIERDGAAFLAAARTASSVPAIAIFSGSINLPDRLKFPFGIYASSDIQSGEDSVIRSLYGERDVTLKEGTSILRWIHTQAELTIQRDCSIYGRASAEKGMRLEAGVEFQRLNARRIAFGETAPDAESPAGTTTYPAYLPPSRAMSKDCFSIDDDLDIPARTVVRGDFVARGKISIGRGARIEGSLKSYGDFRMEPSVVITGSAVSGSDLDVGSDSRILGPAVASRCLRIRAGARVGSEERPASAIAPSILVAPGALVYGSVWAREKGRVGEADAD